MNSNRIMMGLGGLSKALKALPAEVRERILVSAVDKAAVPIEGSIKRHAPTRTGALRESITTKVISSREKGTAAALVGPDRGYYKGGKRLEAKNGKVKGAKGADRPANYAHLVEYGHVTRKPQSLRGHRRAKEGSLEFVPAKPFMRPGFEAAASTAQRILEEDIGGGIRATFAANIGGSNRPD